MVFRGGLILEEKKRGWELSDKKDICYTETCSDFVFCKVLESVCSHQVNGRMKSGQSAWM